jgi:DNA-3-methyladenine glycosylase I
MGWRVARQRCFWASREPLRSYHDEEWGVPRHDDRVLFEFLVLEGMQAGLSWETILRKRDAFRDAFAGFDPEQFARFGKRDIERLMRDTRIVRNRAKIEAAIANGRAALALREDGPPLVELLWSYRGKRRHRPRTLADLPSTTPEATDLSRELKRRGFRFVGPTTVYATMQACGVVNDHLGRCFVRAEVEREQQAVASRLGLSG